MNDRPMVSVITPVYNHEQFVGEAIKSVIDQTYRNWEMLVIDDYSTDKSWEIIQEWARKDSRIRAFRNDTNKGLVPNWKFLIDNSKGDHIAFLEGDDVLCAENLEKKVAVFERYADLGMVYCDFAMIDDAGKTIIPDYYRKVPVKTYRNEAIRPEEYLSSRYAPFSTYSQVMIQRSVLAVSGYPRSLDENAKVFLPSDWDFNFRVSTKNMVYFLDDILLRYRKHNGNNSSETPKASPHYSLLLDLYEREFLGDEKVQNAIRYMRGKILYLNILYYLENARKKEAWKMFSIYLTRYPGNLFRDISINMRMFIRLFLPNRINNLLKKIYFGT